MINVNAMCQIAKIWYITKCADIIIIVQMPLHAFLSGNQQWLDLFLSNRVSVMHQCHPSLGCNLPPNVFGYLTQLHRLQ